MQIPAQVTFRDMPVSDEIQQACWKESEKLDRYYDRITSCRVTVSMPHKHHRKGNLYDIRIDLTVPGGELVVNREPAKHHQDEDPHVAVHDAFKRIRRQLEDFVQKQRGDVKSHD